MNANPNESNLDPDPKLAPMTTTSVRRGQPIEIVSATEVPPQGTGQIHHRVGAGGLILRDLDVEEGVEIINVRAANQLFERKNGELWSDVLSTIDQVPAGGFIILIAKNVLDETRSLRATIYVDVTPSAVASANASRATTESVAALGQPPQMIGSFQEPMHDPSSLTSSSFQEPGPSASSEASAFIEPATALNDAYPTIRHTIEGGLDMVLPNAGERAVLLVKGFAFALIRYLEHRAPMRVGARHTAARQLSEALLREGALGGSATEFVVLLTPAQITLLAASLRTRSPVPDAERPAIVRALKAAIERDAALSRARRGETSTSLAVAGHQQIQHPPQAQEAPGG